MKKSKFAASTSKVYRFVLFPIALSLVAALLWSIINTYVNQKHPLLVNPSTLSMNPITSQLSYVDVLNRRDTTVYMVRLIIEVDVPTVSADDLQITPTQIDKSLDHPNPTVNINYDVLSVHLIDPKNSARQAWLKCIYRIPANSSKNFKVELHPRSPIRNADVHLSFRTLGFSDTPQIAFGGDVTKIKCDASDW